MQNTLWYGKPVQVAYNSTQKRCDINHKDALSPLRETRPGMVRHRSLVAQGVLPVPFTSEQLVMLRSAPGILLDVSG